jgi:hypothetical protein
MAEHPCSGQASEAVLTAEHAAVEMYRFAALMLGNEAQALQLVESTVAGVDIDPCADPARAQGLVRERVVVGTLAIMHQHDPDSFGHVPATQPGAPCIEDDETSPVSRTEISAMVAGAERGRFRDWLDRLSLAQRAVFVQRAVLGSSNADTARAINHFASPAIWTAEAVSGLFRQALCSLASAMVQSAPAIPV